MIDLQGINENFQFWQSQFWQYDWISTISLLFGGNSQMNNNSINLITFLSNDFRKLNTTIYPIFFAINERNCSCLFCEIPEWIISLSISSHFLEMISANKLNITTYPIFFPLNECNCSCLFCENSWMNSNDNLQFDVQFFPGTEIKGSHCYQYHSFI